MIPVTTIYCGSRVISFKQSFWCLLQYNHENLQGTICCSKTYWQIEIPFPIKLILKFILVKWFADMSLIPYSQWCKSSINCLCLFFFNVWLSKIDSVKDDKELHEVLLQDDVLEVLEQIGYKGVPQKETQLSSKSIIEWVSYISLTWLF